MDLDSCLAVVFAGFLVVDDVVPIAAVIQTKARMILQALPVFPFIFLVDLTEILYFSFIDIAWFVGGLHRLTLTLELCLVIVICCLKVLHFLVCV